jgi:hypothetical protein
MTENVLRRNEREPRGKTNKELKITYIDAGLTRYPYGRNGSRPQGPNR